MNKLLRNASTPLSILRSNGDLFQHAAVKASEKWSTSHCKANQRRDCKGKVTTIHGVFKNGKKLKIEATCDHCANAIARQIAFAAWIGVTSKTVALIA